VILGLITFSIVGNLIRLELEKYVTQLDVRTWVEGGRECGMD
jgi:hypothetical protein